VKIDPAIDPGLCHLAIATDSSGNLASDRFDVGRHGGGSTIREGYHKPILVPFATATPRTVARALDVFLSRSGTAALLGERLRLFPRGSSIAFAGQAPLKKELGSKAARSLLDNLDLSLGGVQTRSVHPSTADAPGLQRHARFVPERDLLS
jgi:hypothetical protein